MFRNFKILPGLIFKSFIEVLAPRHCEVCNKYLGTDERRFEFICNDCSDSLPLAPPPDEIYNSLISKFPPDELGISNTYALFSVREDFDYMSIIHSLKYNGFKRIGREFGLELGNIVLKFADVKYGAIVPVPIHHARRRERGFNQSEIIASSVGIILDVKVRTDIIKRSRYTTTQTLLSREERMKNLIDAFSPYNKSPVINNMNILLIDDVLTSGSTLNTCANCLLEMGARRVDAATLAFA